MRVIFSIQCLQDSAQWLRTPYSSNLMNMDKLRTNLENTGDISQIDWVNNGNIISNTLDCELQDIYEITIEKIHAVSHHVIFISLSFLLNDEGKVYKTFSLNNTLNISDERKLSKAHPLHVSYLHLSSCNETTQSPAPMEVSTIAPPFMGNRRP